MTWRRPSASSHLYRLGANGLHEGQETAQHWNFQQLRYHNTAENTPSMERTVDARLASVTNAVGSRSRGQRELKTREQALATAALNRRARLLATKSRNEMPVAMPRTPQSFFCKAVKDANLKYCSKSQRTKWFISLGSGFQGFRFSIPVCKIWSLRFAFQSSGFRPPSLTTRPCIDHTRPCIVFMDVMTEATLLNTQNVHHMRWAVRHDRRKAGVGGQTSS